MTSIRAMGGRSASTGRSLSASGSASPSERPNVWCWCRPATTPIPDLVEAMYAHHPPGSRLVGLWMLVGYLDLLIAEGAVVERTVDGVWRYAAT